MSSSSKQYVVIPDRATPKALVVRAPNARDAVTAYVNNMGGVQNGDKFTAVRVSGLGYYSERSARDRQRLVAKQSGWSVSFA